MIAIKVECMKNMPSDCDFCYWFGTRPHPYKGWTDICELMGHCMDDDQPEEWIYSGDGRPKACPLVEVADRKTENSSEKPNNCEECKHWNDTEDGCADRHGCKTTEDLQDWKDRMWAEAVEDEPTTEDCSTVWTSSKMEQVDEPQTCSVNGRPYTDCCNCEHFRCTADEPQTERSSE